MSNKSLLRQLGKAVSRHYTMKYKSFNAEFVLALLIALPAFVILLSSFAILYGNGFQISSLKFIGIGSAIYFLLAFLIWKNTYYRIESGILQIRNFGIINKRIAVNQIIRIKEVSKKPATPTQPGWYNTNNSISGFLIHTKANETFYLSPIKGAAFLTELQKWNPKIEHVGGEKRIIPTTKK